mmetsp:Transcript_114457/g.330712  ORF Transcript_114457/g.330712 Transcript_114457/m.330712 type:complete len:276 (+) Transcript_114457:137-964(+)
MTLMAGGRLTMKPSAAALRSACAGKANSSSPGKKPSCLSCHCPMAATRSLQTYRSPAGPQKYRSPQTPVAPCSGQRRTSALCPNNRMARTPNNARRPLRSDDSFSRPPSSTWRRKTCQNPRGTTRRPARHGSCQSGATSPTARSHTMRLRHEPSQHVCAHAGTQRLLGRRTPWMKLAAPCKTTLARATTSSRAWPRRRQEQDPSGRRSAGRDGRTLGAPAKRTCRPAHAMRFSGLLASARRLLCRPRARASSSCFCDFVRNSRPGSPAPSPLCCQ